MRAEHDDFPQVWRHLEHGQGRANAGTRLVLQGDYATGSLLYEESLAVDRELGFNAGVANTMIELGYVFYRLGNLERATACYIEAVSLGQDAGLPNEVANAQFGLAHVALDGVIPQRRGTCFKKACSHSVKRMIIAASPIAWRDWRKCIL